MHRFPRTLAAALTVAVLATTACQGPASTGVPTNVVSNPAFAGKKTGIVKGTVTQEGIEASAYRLFQANPPIAGATVSVTSGGVTTEVRTDGSGNFSAPALQGQDAVITATHSAPNGEVFREVTTVKVPMADEPPIVDVASLVTRRTGSIQGLVELANGQSPEGCDVYVGGTTMVGKVSEKGRFALANVPEGVWDVVIQKPGFGRAVLEDVAVQAGRPMVFSEPVTLTASATGAGVQAAIRDGSGKAVVGATVTLYAADGAATTATSDQQGIATLAGLPDGEYTLQVYRAFYQPFVGKTVTVKDGKAEDLGEIKLQSTTVYFGQASGQVVDETGAPVDGAVVMLDPPVTEQIFTDAQGRFTLDRIMPGEYSLQVSAGGFEVFSRELRIDNAPGTKVTYDEPLLMRGVMRDGAGGAYRVSAAGSRMAELLPPFPIGTGALSDDRVLLYWDAPEPSQWPAGFTSVRYEVQHLDDAAGSPDRSDSEDGDWVTVETNADTSYVLQGDDWDEDEFRVRAVGLHSDGVEYVSDWQEISLKEVAGDAVAAYSVLAVQQKVPAKVKKKHAEIKRKSLRLKQKAKRKLRKVLKHKGKKLDHRKGKVPGKGLPKNTKKPPAKKPKPIVRGVPKPSQPKPTQPKPAPTPTPSKPAQQNPTSPARGPL